MRGFGLERVGTLNAHHLAAQPHPARPAVKHLGAGKFPPAVLSLFGYERAGVGARKVAGDINDAPFQPLGCRRPSQRRRNDMAVT